MISYRPGYYDDFRCTAGACSHTCCAGWEIDIDKGSMEVYKDFPDIMSHIKDSAFVLEGDGERCPFLRDDGLCDLILRYGEDILCDICKDHPRFRNYEGDIEYTGLGLCCEAACDLILGRSDKFSLVPHTDLPYGIDLINDYEGRISEAVAGLSEETAEPSARASYYLTMEILDPKWEMILKELSKKDTDRNVRDRFMDDNGQKFRNLLIYFLYRHKGNAVFASESCRLIAEICVSTGLPVNETARMYSSEIEYSDINNERMGKGDMI